MVAGSGRLRLRRSNRLLRSRDFQWVTRHGSRAASRYFVVLAAVRRSRCPSGSNRLGITVSRKVGDAVVRNRVKRRIREWFRRHSADLGGVFDLVVIARPAAAKLQQGTVDCELLRLGESAMK